MPGAEYGRQLREDEDCQVGWEHKSEMTIQQEIIKSAIHMLSENNNSASFEMSQPFSAHRGSSNKVLKFGEGELNQIKEDDESSKSATSHTCTDKTDELDEDFENVPEHSKSLAQEQLVSLLSPKHRDENN